VYSNLPDNYPTQDYPGETKFMDAIDATSRLIRLSEVCKLTGFAKSYIYNQIRKGNFPAPVKIGSKSVRWELHKVLAWIQQHKSSNLVAA